MKLLSSAYRYSENVHMYVYTSDQRVQLEIYLTAMVTAEIYVSGYMLLILLPWQLASYICYIYYFEPREIFFVVSFLNDIQRLC